MAQETQTANPSENSNTIICYAPAMITTNGIWQGDKPLDYSVPLFILQLALVIITTRTFVIFLKPLRQPRVISEIMAGLFLGPSVLGRNHEFASKFFPLRSVMMLEAMANVGLLYFLFLIGVEMDISIIRRTGKKAIAIAIGGMVLPFVVVAVFSFILDKNTNQGTNVLFFGVAVSVTAFPVLARILEELKLISSELGKLALSAALVNDVCSWILLGIAIAFSENNVDTLASLYSTLSGIGFVVICFFAVRPTISWMVTKTPDSESFSELSICLIIIGVMISGVITDAIGTHYVFGAFVFGLIIPHGQLAVTLVEQLEDFVSGLLLPLYFAISGLRTNLAAINGSTWVVLIVVNVLACIGKVTGSVIVGFFYRMPLREGITLGLLMNTKGLIELIMLNIGKEQKILDESTFAIMVIEAVFMTGIITPIVTTIYSQTRRSISSYNRRTIQRSKADAEVRVLVCVHTPRNVPTTIDLLEASNPTKWSPLSIYVLHLVELSGRSSAMLNVHNSTKGGRPANNRTQAQSEHIINAFENFENHVSFVNIQHLTVISPYSTMHEDICILAEDKCVAFIIIPFHKQQTVDGGMEAVNPSFRMLNQNLLAFAPCSIGILVDRGLNSGKRMNASQVTHHVVVLFFGGPDDREGLSYAWRMSENQGISLLVVRFVHGDEIFGFSRDPTIIPIETEAEKENQLDDEFITEFSMKTANDDSITYTTKVVNNGEETVAAIRSIESTFDLYIVGRGQGMKSPLTAGLTDWSECPELGSIGDLLASSDFAATVSVLVVQQYVGPQGDEVGTLDDTADRGENVRNTWHGAPRFDSEAS